MNSPRTAVTGAATQELREMAVLDHFPKPPRKPGVLAPSNRSLNPPCSSASSADGENNPHALHTIPPIYCNAKPPKTTPSRYASKNPIPRPVAVNGFSAAAPQTPDPNSK